MLPEDEAAIRQLCERQQWQEATTLILERYGQELAAYVNAICAGSGSDEAYSDFALELWKSLPGFEWRCSARGFAFMLARRAAHRRQRVERVARAQGQRWEMERWLYDAVARTRTPTPHHQRSEVKSKMRALRAHLSEEERSLLILRVDRELPFSDLAEVLGAPEELAEPAGRQRVEARLRKRFQTVKEKLRRLAEDNGLLGGT